MCPVGCNVSATTREGKVKRILSRNHPEVDEGWICDKGRFALHAPARRRPHRRPGQARPAGAGFEPRLLGRGARRGGAAAARGGGPHRHRALRLRDGRAGVRARRSSCAGSRRRTRRCCPRRSPTPSTRTALPLSAIRDAQVVVVLGDVPVAERAPVVDLWIKAARRNGARILTTLDEKAVRGADRAVLIWSGPGGRAGARVAELRRARSGSPARRAAAPSTFPRRRTAAGSPTRGRPPPTRRARDTESIGLLIVSGDEAATDPNVRALAEQAETRDRDLDVPRPGGRLGRPRPPGHELPRARRDVRQPRGAPAAAAPRGDAARAGRARVGSRSSPRASASRSRRTRRRCSRSCRSAASAVSRSARSASARRCAATPRRRSASRCRRCRRPEDCRRAGCGSSATSRSSPGPRSSASRSSSSSARRRRSSSPRDDAKARGIATGDTVTVSHNGTSVHARARVATGSPRRASRASRASTPATSAANVEVSNVTEPWWISHDQGRGHRQPRARPVRVPRR